MSKTVGVTCALATRLVLEKKVSERGVLSPMAKEIYQPILDELEKHHGVTMVEESAIPQAWAKMYPPKNRARM